MMFPKIKKRIASFLLDESGSITKKAIILLGINAALISATTRATAYQDTPTPEDATLTHRRIDQTETCRDSWPEEVNVVVDPYACECDGHEDCTDHDSANAQASAHIKITSGTFNFDKDVVCEHASDHDDGSCYDVEAHGDCEVTINGATSHTNSLTMSETGGTLTATHDHSIAPAPIKICLTGSGTGCGTGTAPVRGVGRCYSHGSDGSCC